MLVPISKIPKLFQPVESEKRMYVPPAVIKGTPTITHGGETPVKTEIIQTGMDTKGNPVYEIKPVGTKPYTPKEWFGGGGGSYGSGTDLPFDFPSQYPGGVYPTVPGTGTPGTPVVPPITPGLPGTPVVPPIIPELPGTPEFNASPEVVSISDPLAYYRTGSYINLQNDYYKQLYEINKKKGGDFIEEKKKARQNYLDTLAKEKQTFDEKRKQQIETPKKIYSIDNINLNVKTPTTSTTKDYGLKVFEGDLYLNPYIKQVLTPTKEKTGYDDYGNPVYNIIPAGKYFYVDSFDAKNNREATPEEIEKYKDYEKALSYETGTASNVPMPIYKPLLDTIANEYNFINQNLRTDLTLPIERKIIKVTGKTPEELINLGVDVGVLGINSRNLNSFEKVKDFEKGFITYVYEDIRDQPLKQALTYGVGAGLGFAFKGVSAGLALIPKVGGYASSAFKVGAIGYGVYTVGGAVADTSIRAFQAETAREAGAIVAESAKDFALIGFGFKGGEKVYGAGRGEVRVWFDNYKQDQIDFTNKIKSGIFPSAPKGQHLPSFEGNIIEGLSYDVIADKVKLAKEYAEFNLKNQLALKESAIYPEQHAYPHLKEIAINTQKIIDAYPELHKYLIKEYGSLNNAKAELGKGGFLHDLLKVSSSSGKNTFGLNHGEILYELYKTGNLPEGIKISPKVAEAIRMHEITAPKKPSVEFQILSTADRLNFDRFEQGVNKELLPLKDAIERLQKLPEKKYKMPKIDFNKDTSEFLKKYKIVNGEIVPKNAKGVAIHTGFVPKTEEINPAIRPGKSEFSNVLYVSTQVSTAFSEISGSGGKYPKSLKAFQQAILKMFAPEVSPRITVVQPEGFRIGKWVWRDFPASEGQRAVRGRDGRLRYAHLTDPAEAGVLDVPLMKTEIEALVRTKFGKGETKGYFKIQGEKVPVDLSKPIMENVARNLEQIKKDINRNLKEKYNVAEEDKKAFDRLKKEYAEEKKVKPEQIKIQQKPEKFGWDDMTSQGKEMIKKTIEIEAKYDVEMAELSGRINKLTKAQKEKLIDARYNKLLADYKLGISEKGTTQASELFQKAIKQEEAKPTKLPESPSLKESIPVSSVLKSLQSEISSMRSSLKNSMSSSMSSINSSISKSIESSIASSRKSLASYAPSGRSSSSKISEKPSAKSSLASTNYKSGGEYYFPIKGTIPKEIILPRIKLIEQKQIIKKEKRSLGQGYNVYGKLIKTNKFGKLNESPVSRVRALDIGSFFIVQSVARTYKIQKASGQAQEDNFYQIPYGYYETVKYQLREFKIKNKQPYAFGEQFIQKGKFSISSEAEKKQLAYFRNIEKNMLK